MLTVKTNLINILETFCPDNVYLQGTLNENDAFPETFITFFITDSDFDAFYDNDPHAVNWSGSVMFYSTDPETIAQLLGSVMVAMRQNGFIPQGMGNDIPSGIETHTGYALDFIYQDKFN